MFMKLVSVKVLYFERESLRSNESQSTNPDNGSSEPFLLNVLVFLYLLRICGRT